MTELCPFGGEAKDMELATTSSHSPLRERFFWAEMNSAQK